MTKNKKGKKISSESKGNAAEATTTEDVTNKEDEKAMGKDNNDLHCQKVALSEGNSRKRRNRVKSRIDTSKTEATACMERERQKLDCAERLLLNLGMQKLIYDRISRIESGISQAKDIVHGKKYKLVSSTSQEKKQKTTFTTRDEKVQDSSESKPAIKSNSTNPVKNYTSSSSGLTLTTVVKKTASANTPQNVAEKKREKGDNVKSINDSHATMQSKAEAKNENKKASGYYSENLTFLGDELIFETKKKTSVQGKIDDKSLPSTSETESIINPDYERYKLYCSDTLCKDVDMRKLNSQSSTNESGTTDDSKFGFYRPVIFVMDISTQTDPLQEPPNLLKCIDAENKSKCNSDSDCTVITEAKETDLQERITRTANVSEDSCSNLNSLDENLQSISQDFLKDFKIANERFTDGFIKCFMD